MKILHIIQSVDLAQGGPIESLVRSEPAWRRLGHSREIVCLDLPDDACVADCPLPTHAMGSAATRRWKDRMPPLRYGFAPRLVPWLRAHAREFDVIVVNGLWNFADLAARRVLPTLGQPYFVFTHGMLDPWFRRAYPRKHLVKQLVWWLVEGPLTRHARAVLFTSDGEQSAAGQAFWPSRFRSEIAGYGTAAPPVRSAQQTAAFEAAVPALRGRYLLFMGRLHPKKGCDLLLQAFARIASVDPALDLVMAGPDGNDARPGLERLADALGIGDRVHWPGMLSGPAKWGAFHGCEAFALPSHGENFGVAVVEAMACEKPVLISDRVNIAPTIAASDAGLVGPDTIEGTHELLQDLLALRPSERDAMGNRARRCFEAFFDMDRVVHRTADLLARAVQA